MNPELLLNHFDRISGAPDAIPRLRSFILDLAVRGKLVEQDPEGKPEVVVGHSLAIRHRGSHEHERLAGDQVWPYELPSSWQWQKLGDISEQVTDGEHATPPRIQEQQVPLVMAKNIRDGFMNYGNTDWVSFSTAEKAWKRCRPSVGDILLVCVGATIGRLCALREARDMVLVRSVALIRPSSAINVDYLELALRSPVSYAQMWAKIKVSAQPCLYINRINSLPVAFPPIEEQRRIVSKVDELMALCDRLEVARNEREDRRDLLAAASLHHLDNGANAEAFRSHARFYLGHFPRLTTRPEHVQRLRETILRLAVRGQLVPRDRIGEPASELLKRIQGEKVKLIKEGILRKEKPLPPVADDEVPFAVPTSWSWARIGTVSLLTEYGTSVKSDHAENGIPVLKMGDIQGGQVILGGQKKVPRQIKDLPQLFLKRFDLLYNRTNSAELVGKTGIYMGDDDTYTFASYLIRIRFLSNLTSPVYANIAMNAPYFRATQIVPELQQQCGQANVNGTKLRNMLIPVPPLAEQHQIVAIVEQLMALCSQLERQLATSQTESCRLLESVLHHALAAAEPSSSILNSDPLASDFSPAARKPAFIA